MNVSSGAQAVEVAKQWLGTPYRWGGGHSGSVKVGTPVDCSGLVNQVFGITGTTYTQEAMGSAVPNINAALPGDLVFFGPLAPNEAYHVGIYTGSGMMIDAPHTGTNVRYDSVGGFGQIAAIRRLVPPGSVSGGSNGTSVTTTVNYTYAQLEGLWIQAGGNAQAAPMAAAIAMAESGGNSQATDNDSNGSVDRGLWQINSVHGAQSTYDVMGNARAAVAISNNGTNWSPWVTYQNGAYQRYLQSGVAPDMSVPINATNAAANQPGGGGTATEDLSWGGVFSAGQCLLNPIECNVSSAAGGVASMLASNIIKGIVGAILNPLIQIIAGILGIAAGGGLMIVGLYLMFNETQTGRRAIGAGMMGAGMATGQPELMAAGRGAQGGAFGMLSGASGQRTTTIRGQQVAQRQEAGRTAVTQREVYRQQSMTTRDQLRQQAYRYNQNAAAQQRSGLSAQQHQQRSALSAQQHRQRSALSAQQHRQRTTSRSRRRP